MYLPRERLHRVKFSRFRLSSLRLHWVYSITHSKITPSRVTWGKLTVIQDKDKITQGKSNEVTITQDKNKVTQGFNQGKDKVTKGKFYMGKDSQFNLSRHKYLE